LLVFIISVAGEVRLLFSRPMSAVIGAFEVLRVRDVEELNDPLMGAFDVWRDRDVEELNSP